MKWSNRVHDGRRKKRITREVKVVWNLSRRDIKAPLPKELRQLRRCQSSRCNSWPSCFILLLLDLVWLPSTMEVRPKVGVEVDMVAAGVVAVEGYGGGGGGGGYGGGGGGYGEEAQPAVSFPFIELQIAIRSLARTIRVCLWKRWWLWNYSRTTRISRCIGQRQRILHVPRR